MYVEDMYFSLLYIHLYRLKSLKLEKVQLDAELNSLHAQLVCKERAIQDIEEILSVN